MEAMGGRRGIRGFLTKKLQPAVLFNAAVRLEAADIGKPLPVEEDQVFRTVAEVLADMDARGMSPALLRHHADALEEFQAAKRAGKPYVYKAKPRYGRPRNERLRQRRARLLTRRSYTPISRLYRRLGKSRWLSGPALALPPKLPPNTSRHDVTGRYDCAPQAPENHDV
jgi:hypothetical protein